MTIIRRLLSNPTLLIGIIRAAAVFLASYGFSWLSDAHTAPLFTFLGLLVAGISLALTGVSASATDAAIQQALNTPAPGQAPAPGTPDAT